MLQDRRRAQRHAVACAAKIKFDAAPPRDCIVADLSDDGVRVVATGTEVPEEFMLLLDGAASRACSVVWRLDDEIGAEFLDTAEDGWLDAALARFAESEC
jgi:PilZ domain-containing protein